MTIRKYFEAHPRFNGDETFRRIPGADDSLLFSGVPLDGGVFDMLRAGRYDEQIPEASMIRLREIGGFCG